MARGLCPAGRGGERKKHEDTTQARQMLELAGTPPHPAMEHTAELSAVLSGRAAYAGGNGGNPGCSWLRSGQVDASGRGMSYGIPCPSMGKPQADDGARGRRSGASAMAGVGRPRVQYAPGYPQRDLQLLEEKIKDKARL